jgi:hypothetical protein
VESVTATSTLGTRTSCDWCREPIVWLLTVNGSRMPVDAGLDPRRGNVLREGERAHVIGKASQAAAMRAAGKPLHVHHRLSCPYARRWTRDGAR